MQKIIEIEPSYGYHNLLLVLFSGPDRDVEGAAVFIQSIFLSQNRHNSKVIYPHFTTATDTSNIQVVFEVLVDTIIKENLRTNIKSVEML